MEINFTTLVIDQIFKNIHQYSRIENGETITGND
jgi:hypothetical protein